MVAGPRSLKITSNPNHGIRVNASTVSLAKDRPRSTGSILTPKFRTREEMSFDKAVMRLRRGRAITLRSKPILPGMPAFRTEYTFLPNNHLSNTHRNRMTCCNGLHNGRFPSIASNRIDLNANGAVCVRKRHRDLSPDIVMDLLNLPPLPCSLKLGTPFEASGHRNQLRQIVTHSALNDFVAAKQPSHSQKGILQYHPAVTQCPHPVRNPIFVATESALNQHWLKMGKDFAIRRCSSESLSSFDKADSSGSRDECEFHSPIQPDLTIADLQYLSNFAQDCSRDFSG
ncbi:unnamed protein product [Dicrocoelium dendriticum]|nr:unnamed protein product [Dicrocoelium dendriticum]